MSGQGDLVASVAEMLRATGVSLDDVAAVLAATDSDASTETVTFGEVVERALRAMTFNTRRTYRTALDRACRGVERICECLCDTCVEEPEGACGCPPSCRRCDTAMTMPALAAVPVTTRTMSTATFKDCCEIAGRIARRRAVAENKVRVERGLAEKPTHGSSAQETAVRAYKAAMEQAIDLGLLDRNPMERVKAPRRHKTTKRGLRGEEFVDFFRAVGAGGNDIDLDMVLCWFHLETGARRGGAVSLTLGDLRDSDQVVELHEKGSTVRLQPVSKELLAALRTHAAQRGGPETQPGNPLYDPSRPVFYYQPRPDGSPHPLTGRRYDTLFRRVQKQLPFAGEIQLTAHGLRKGAAAIVERIGGTQVARHFLGHAERSVTDMYAESSTAEVATAVSEWTGAPHPLAIVRVADPVA